MDIILEKYVNIVIDIQIYTDNIMKGGALVNR